MCVDVCINLHMHVHANLKVFSLLTIYVHTYQEVLVVNEIHLVTQTN